jgi:NADH-quinone oxidoreductase subunit J
MVRNLVKASIALAFTSATLTIILFLLKSPLAAVFELSVCAGLITVVFISTISLTKSHTKDVLIAKVKERRRRFIYLPFILLALVFVFLWSVLPNLDMQIIILAPTGPSVREVLWNTRQLEILGQIIMILAGVYGVVVLFKEREVK